MKRSILRQFIIQATVTILLLVVQFVLVYQIRNARKTLFAAQENRRDSMILAFELRQTSFDLTKYCRQYVITGDMSNHEKYYNILDWRSGNIPRPESVMAFRGETISEIDLLKRIGCTEHEISLLNEATKLSNELAVVEEQAMGVIREGRFITEEDMHVGEAEDGEVHTTPIALRMNYEGESTRDFATRLVYDITYQNKVQFILATIDEFVASVLERTESEVQNANSTLATYQMTLFVLIILVVISIVLFVIFINNFVINKIISATKNFAHLGKGDLTKQMVVSRNDEIGRMAQDFNKTLSNVRTLIGVVDDNAKSLALLGVELSSNMEETASAITEISANLVEMQKQTESQSDSTQKISDSSRKNVKLIEHLDDVIESQSASVEESSAAIEEMARNVTSITNAIEKAANAIKELSSATGEGEMAVHSAGESMQKIISESGSLLEASGIIQNIASQTNLLAMNAAIEAAHAGESGRGFAVVAGEIRKLAEESSRQGKKITDALKSLSSEISLMSEGMVQVNSKFTTISSLSDQVYDLSIGVTGAMKEQENASTEVLEAIQNISGVTGDVKNSSKQLLREIDKTRNEIETLENISSIVTAGITEVASGANQITSAVDHVNDLTQKNKQNIGDLEKSIGIFTI